MAGLTKKLSGPKFEQMLADLRAISAEPTLTQIRDVMIRYGLKSPTSKDGNPSVMAAKTLRDGPWKRYIERIQAGREAREQLCAAAGAGAHALDALEEAAIIELQDHFTAADGGVVDIKFVVDQLTKLRASLSLRENSRRQQQDLERKLRESKAAIDVAAQREKLLQEQVAALKRAKADWEKRRADATAALAKAEKKGGVTPDTRKLIEDVMAGRVAA